MDNFAWELINPSRGATDLGISSSLLGSNHYNDTCSKSSTQAIIDDPGITGGDVDLAEALLISSKGLHGVVVKANGRTRLDVSLPPSHQETVRDSSVVAGSSQSQEALLLAAAEELATSADAGAPWADALASLGHLREHFGLPSEPPQVHINVTDDDDVSAILLSNCDNIPNLSNYSGNVSSGESENCSSLHKGGEKRSRRRCFIVDDAVTQVLPNEHPMTHFMTLNSGNNLKRERKIQEIGGAGGGEGSLCQHILPSSDSSASDQRGGGRGGFRIFFENAHSRNWKKHKSDKNQQRASSIDFRLDDGYEPDAEALAQVKEMIYRAAAMRPVSLGAVEAPVEKPRRKNVRISSDPQTVAARHRRERISERLRALQRLVPGGSKMDTASMLDEAANYLKFLKSQISALETLGAQAICSTVATISSISLPLSTSFSHQQDLSMQTLLPQTQNLAQVQHHKGNVAARVPKHHQLFDNFTLTSIPFQT